MTAPTVGVAPLAAAFRDGSDDPVRALDRMLAAADRGKDDKAILWRVPGARAVASGFAPGALGTDAGGSIRVPAAINGLVGLKPTYEAVPLEGVAGLTLDLDHVGPIAWTVEDATQVFEVISARAVDRTAQARS